MENLNNELPQKLNSVDILAISKPRPVIVGDNLISTIQDKSKENFNLLHRFYAHGSLELWLEFDLIWSDIQINSEGIYQAVAINCYNRVKQCLLFVWYGGEHLRGLAIDPEDLNGMKFAMEKYEARVQYL